MSDKELTAPAENGSAGTQEESTDEPSTDVVVIPPFEQDPLIKHTAGLSSDAYRRSPAIIDREWMAATVQHYYEDVRATRKELQEVRRELDTCREDRGNFHSKIEVLTERLRNYTRSRLVTHVFTAIGAGLVVLGVENWSEYDRKFSVLAIVVGLLAVGLSLWMSPKGDDK